MDYDFSNLALSQLETLRKKLESAKKVFIKEYFLAIQVINSENLKEDYKELRERMEVVLDGAAQKSRIAFTQALNDISDSLLKRL
jgi:hypothetical protein